jgi:hypothetical protein
VKRTQHRVRWRGKRFSYARYATWGDVIGEVIGFYEGRELRFKGGTLYAAWSRP